MPVEGVELDRRRPGRRRGRHRHDRRRRPLRARAARPGRLHGAARHRRRCPTTSSCATRPRPSWSVNIRPAERQVLNYFLGESLRQTEGRWDILPQTIANGIKFGLIIAITAVGLSLIYGTTGLSNFAHGELVTLGAIVAWWMNQSVGLHILLAAPIGIAAGGARRASSSEAGLWRPLRRKGVSADVDDDRVDRRRARRPLPLPYTFGGRSRAYRQYAVQSAVDIGPYRLTKRDLVSMVICVIVLRRRGAVPPAQPPGQGDPRRVRQPRAGVGDGHQHRPGDPARVGRRRRPRRPRRHPPRPRRAGPLEHGLHAACC